ncbi:MAG: hypothetical protein ACRCWI_04015 [Brevinema sp.]
MKKQFYIISTFIFLAASCSTIPESPSELMGAQKYSLTLEEKNRLYPFWDVHLRGFQVNSGGGKTLKVDEKRRMLRHLSLLRFTMNTPEFATNILNGEYYANRNISSKDGKRKVQSGDKLDPQRLLDILRYRSYPFTIRKQSMPGAVGMGAVPNHYLYLEEFSSSLFRGHLWIGFPDTHNWNTGGYLQDAYITGVILHEMLHNMGFSHGGTMPESKEVLRQIQNNYKKTLNKEFYTKYQKQLEVFGSFYEERNANELTFETINGSPIPPTNPLLSYNTSMEYRVVDSYPDNLHDDEEVVCVLKEDGTYELRIIKSYGQRDFI